MDNHIKIFTTLRREEGEKTYYEEMKKLIQNGVKYGFEGSLFFQNNSTDIEPWVIAQDICCRFPSQSPFIAVNPIYMHPYTVAQKIQSLANLYKRKLYLNFIAGTSISDMEAINLNLPHEDRYERLIEYIKIIIHLLTDTSPLTFKGKYYITSNLQLTSTLDKSLLPNYFISGSSTGANRSRELTGAAKLEMAKPLTEMKSKDACTLHFGILARETSEEAQQYLSKKFNARYEETEELLEYAMRNADAIWKKQLKEFREDNVYRLTPFRNFKADCPYLVGSFEQVAAYISNYTSLGANLFVVETTVQELNSLYKVMKLVDNGTTNVKIF